MDEPINDQPQPMQHDITRAGVPMGMRPGQRVLNTASLTVAMSDAVPLHMRPNVREITHFQVAPEDRRKKLGTLLLNMVCQEADANKITLLLIARPMVIAEGEISEAQLVHFYGQFGFTILQTSERGVLMARQIHAPRVALVNEAGRANVHRAVRQALRSVH
jgi:GNAT superfamily N-acetyltransferase